MRLLRIFSHLPHYKTNWPLELASGTSRVNVIVSQLTPRVNKHVAALARTADDVRSFPH